jgi:plasmid maintenance system antidote protein VapI
MTPLEINSLELPTYNPVRFLSLLQETMNIKSDCALAEQLEVSPSVISRMRHRRSGLSAETLLIAHTVSGLSIDELKEAAGLPVWRNE